IKEVSSSQYSRTARGIRSRTGSPETKFVRMMLSGRANSSKRCWSSYCGRVTRRWKNPIDVCEAAPTVYTVVICFASFRGSANGLEFEHQREVGSVSGEVLLSQGGDATSICAITAQP